MVTDSETKKSDSAVQTLFKGFRVFEYVCHAEKDVRVVEIAKYFGINKTTVYRLLRTLVELGYIEQDSFTDRYRPTMQILSLGNYVINKLSIRALSLELIKELSKKAGESVHLSVCDKTETVIIDKVESRSASKISFHIGRRADLYSTGTGKVFLAVKQPYELEEYLQNVTLVAHTPMTLVSPDDLKRELAEIREQGFAIDRQENQIGVSCVAGPVRDYSGSVVASVSVTGPSSHIENDIEHLGKLILEYTARISHKLGYNR